MIWVVSPIRYNHIGTARNAAAGSPVRSTKNAFAVLTPDGLGTMGNHMLSVHTFRAVLAASASLGALTLAVGCPAQAQTYQELQGIVIEAGGLAPVEAEKAGSAATVITGDELEKRQIRNAADALRTVPGLAVSQTGGSGGLTSVRVRGAEANHVVVRIDGVEVNGLSDGAFDFATLLAHDIERIEVVRGPQSGVFGGNALSGVINIVTKKGSGPARVTASAEGGSMNTRATSASASGGSERAYFSVSTAERTTSGFNLAKSGTEKDGSEQRTIFTRAGVAIVENFRIDGMFRYQFNGTDADDDWGTGTLFDLANYTNQRDQMLGNVTATLDLFDKHWQQKVFLNGFRDDFESRYPGFSLYTNSGDRTHWGYQSSWNFDTPAFLAAKHTLTGLAEQRRESFEISTSDATYKREQTSYAAEYRGEFLDRILLSGNIRRDLNDTFDDATTYRLTTAYLLKDTGTRLHASYGKGVKNPTFIEQFGWFSQPPFFYGNPNLRPEQSLGWDIGVEQKLLRDKLVIDVTYFESDLTDKIKMAMLDVTGDGVADPTVTNDFGKSNRHGVEVTLTARPLAGLVLTGSYTYTDAEDANGEKEIRRPKHSGSVRASYAFLDGRAEINGGVTYNGAMTDKFYSAVSSVWLDDYILIDIGASYKIDDRITLFGRVENLLDSKYEEIYGYNSAPIAAYGGMKVSFTDDRPLEPLK